MDDAQRLPLRAVQRHEEGVEESRVVPGQVEARRVGLEEAEVLLALGGEHRLAALLQQLLRRGTPLHLPGQHFGERRKAQPQDAPGRVDGAEHRQQGDDTEEEQQDAAAAHRSFQTLRYSCRAHISSR